jgi:lauroyl/myristoyl acyltransferase
MERGGLPRVVTAAFQVGTAAAGALPGPVSRGMAETSGVMASHMLGMGSRRRVVAANLRRVCGPGIGRRRMERLVDEAFASYARYWAESLRLPALTDAEVAAGISCSGIERLDAALDAGGGAILALPHLGGWEWGGRWLAATGRPVTVVVERLRPDRLFEWFAGYRRRLGMDVVALGPEAGAAAVAALRANRVLCLLCDRVVGEGSGIPTQMFGETVLLPPGPVTLAMRTGAPLLPTAVYFGAATDDHQAVIGPPVEVPRHGRLRDDVAANTQAVAVELESLIRRAPTQWHLMQPNWPVGPGTAGG